MACNNDEVWNPEKAEIRITILPPWWLSNGMLVVYGILIVLAIALGYALLLQRTNRRHRNKIAALHHENERKLFDAKIGFLTHITHEIRTPVTLILAPVEEIMRQKNIPEEIRDDLEVVKRNSERLLDLVNQILDFTKAEQEAFPPKIPGSTSMIWWKKLYSVLRLQLSKRGYSSPTILHNRSGFAPTGKH